LLCESTTLSTGRLERHHEHVLALLRTRPPEPSRRHGHSAKSARLARTARPTSAQAADLAPAVVPPRRLDATEVPYPAEGRGDATVELVLLVDTEVRVAQVMVKDGRPPFSTAALSRSDRIPAAGA